MNDIANKLTATMLEELETVDFGHENELRDSMSCLEVTNRYRNLLQEAMLTGHFENQESEIQFYKNQKPIMDARALYYQTQLGIVQQTPLAGWQEQMAFFKSELQKITEFQRQHKDMFLYYKLQYTHLDNYYFTRASSEVLFPVSEVNLSADKRFYAPGSLLFSWFLAQELLESNLQRQIWYAGSQAAHEQSITADLPFKWSGTQAEFVEFVYFVNETALLNGVVHQPSKVMAFFSQILQFNAGNYYKTHDNNGIRKIPTPLLDRGKLALLRRYEADNEKKGR